MENGRIVKFLILIFAVLTAVFYLLYCREDRRNSVLDENFVQQTVENLSSRGIEIDGSVIQKSLPEQKIYVFTAVNNEHYAEKVANSFAKVFQKDTFFTKLNTPDGFSMALYDSSDKENEVGNFQFSQSDLSFVYSAVSSSISKYSSVIYGNTEAIDIEKLALVEKILLNLNDDKNMSYKIIGSVSDNDYSIISAVQTFEGLEIAGVYINFVFEKNELVNALGSWVVYSPVATYHEKLIDGINVLYKLELDEISRIVDERIVYTLKKGKDNQYFILPCWEITAVEKSGGFITQHFDAF